MATLTSKQARWVSAVLANDENSSDQELVEYFIENGLDADTAAKVIAQRDKFLSDPGAVLEES